MVGASWQAAALVALGGAIGSVLRWAAIAAVAERFGDAFPWGTLLVNVAGSFTIGVVAQLAAAGTPSHPGVTPAVRLFVATGILGGFTTFSAFSLDALTLTRAGAPGGAALYVAASVAIGLGAAYAGTLAVRLLATAA